MHQCRLRLTEQAAALQGGIPGPGGLVTHEPPGHFGGVETTYWAVLTSMLPAYAGK